MCVDQFAVVLSKKVKSKDAILLAIFFCAGIVSAMSLLSHQVTNPDGILAGELMQGFSWEIATGRWATAIIYSLRGGIIVPLLTSLVSIAFFAMATLLVLQLFQIKGFVLRLLVGCMLMTFPSLVQYLSYFYTADTFAVSTFLAVLAIYLLKTHKSTPKIVVFILSLFSLIMSMSIYQAMIGIAAFLCLGIVYIDTADEKKSLSSVGKEVIYFLLLGVLAIACYFALSRLVCNITGIPLADFRGISSADRISISTLPEMLRRMYTTFFSFYFTNQYYPYTRWYLHFIFAAVFTLWIVSEIYWGIGLIRVSVKKKTNFYRILIQIILIISLPAAATMIGLIASNTAIDFKMIPQMMLPVALAVSRLERISETSDRKMLRSLEWGIAGALCLMIWGNTLVSNGIGEAMQMKADAARSLSTRILIEIIESPDYSSNIPIAILGNVENEAWLSENKDYFGKVNSDVVAWGQFWSSEMNTTQRSWYQYYKKYHGVSLNMVDDDVAEEILDTEQFRCMNTFPEAGAIQNIDGVLTVKLSKFGQ